MAHYKTKKLLDNKDIIISKYNSGISGNKLAKEYGIASNNMMAFLRRHGVIIKSRKYRKYLLNFLPEKKHKESIIDIYMKRIGF